MKILIDVDGVMADCMAEFLKELEWAYGTKAKYEDITDFDPAKAGLCSPDEAAETFRALGELDEVRHFEDLPGALDGVAALRNAGHRVVALTSPIMEAGWLEGRADWLLARRFDKKDIVFAWDKTLVPGDILIEDSLANAEAWAAAHPRGLAIVLDRPWNQGVSCFHNMRRAKDWEAVLELVSEPRHTEDCWGWPLCHNGEGCK